MTLACDVDRQASPRLRNIHPGEVLKEDFMTPMGVTAYRLAQATGLSQTQVGEITRGERGITATTALRLAAFFGTTPKFWLNLQTLYDLEAAREKVGEEVARIEKLAGA